MKKSLEKLDEKEKKLISSTSLYAAWDVAELDDAEEQHLLREHAKETLMARFERDVEADPLNRVRVWKKIRQNA